MGAKAHLVSPHYAVDLVVAVAAIQITLEAVGVVVIPVALVALTTTGLLGVVAVVDPITVDQTSQTLPV
jgi:hypothetical protein